MTSSSPHFTDGETEAQKVQVTCLNVAEWVRGRTWFGSWASQLGVVSSSTTRSPQPWPDICVFTPVGTIVLQGGQWLGGSGDWIQMYQSYYNNPKHIFSITQHIYYNHTRGWVISRAKHQISGHPWWVPINWGKWGPRGSSWYKLLLDWSLRGMFCSALFIHSFSCLLVTTCHMLGTILESEDIARVARQKYKVPR